MRAILTRMVVPLSWGVIAFLFSECSSKPDLIITNIVADRTTPTLDGFFVNVTLENVGGSAADIVDGHRISIRTVGTEIVVQHGAFGAGALQPGQSVTQHCRVVPRQAGPQTWTLRVDPDNWVHESNEANNDRDFSVNIGAGSATPGADLGITNVTQDPWDRRKFTITVINIGSGTAVIAPGIAIIAENSSGPWNGVTNDALFILPSGQSRTVVKWVGAPAGDRQITFWVDPENVVPELSEANNYRIGDFTLP